MTVADFAAIIPWLREDEEITLTMRADAYRDAYEMATGGPEIVSTAQAAAVFGWCTRRWREWAKQGLVEGAWQEEESGSWRLPREGCRQRVEQEGEQGRSRLRRMRPEHNNQDVLQSPGITATSNSTNGRSIRRGPRKSEAS